MGKDYVNKKRGPVLMNDFDNGKRESVLVEIWVAYYVNISLFKKLLF